MFACVDDIKPRKRQPIVLLCNTYHSLPILFWKLMHIFSRGNVCGMQSKMSFKLFLSCKHRHISTIKVSFVQSKTYYIIYLCHWQWFLEACLPLPRAKSFSSTPLIRFSYSIMKPCLLSHMCHKVQKIHPILEHRNINYRSINPTSIFTAIFVIHCHFIQPKYRTPIYFLRSAAKKEFKPFYCFDLFFEVTKHNF